MRRLWPLLSLSFLLACSATDDGEGEPGACAEPTSQALSEPCCLDHGVDACGAGLFCAAFDGRTQPTCYLEHSRFDGTECDADLHCVSNSCDPASRKCRAAPGAQCTPEVGCAPDASGNRYNCVAEGEAFRCLRVGEGGYGEVCVDDADCLEGAVCDEGRCTFDLACDLPGDRMGPCIDSPDGFECQQCITSALTACISSCPDQGDTLGMCIYYGNCSDAACILDLCETEFCDFFACAEDNCSQTVECF